MSDSAAKRALFRILKGLPLAIVAPFLLLIAAVAAFLCDFVSKLLPKRLPPSTKPNTAAASIVIPNWNGRDLLEKYLPSVVTAAEKVPESEVIVVDNGSTDGSADFVRQNFPQVMRPSISPWVRAAP